MFGLIGYSALTQKGRVLFSQRSSSKESYQCKFWSSFPAFFLSIINIHDLGFILLLADWQ